MHPALSFTKNLILVVMAVALGLALLVGALFAVIWAFMHFELVFMVVFWVLVVVGLVAAAAHLTRSSSQKAHEAAQKAREAATTAQEAEAKRQADEVEAKRKADEAEQIERTGRVALKQQAQETLELIDHTIRSDCLVLDSNIWMNEAYDSFFYCLRRSATEAHKQLVLYGPQFDEICNLKRTTPYDDPTNRRARLAINRIEQLQKDDLLHIEPVTINAARDAYADPLIVKLLVAEAGTAKSIRFISDDKELRIRVREHLKKHPADQWKIIEIQTLITGCESVIAAEQLNLLSDEA